MSLDGDLLQAAGALDVPRVVDVADAEDEARAIRDEGNGLYSPESGPVLALHAPDGPHISGGEPANDVEPGHGGTDRIPLEYAESLAQPLPPIDWLCRDLNLVAARPTLFSGFGGAGKTMLAQQMLLSVAAGEGRMWDTVAIQKSGPVLHLDYEQARFTTVWRYQRLALGMGLDLASLSKHLAVSNLPPMYLTSEDALDELTRACEGRVLCVIDNLRAGCPTVDENDSRIRIYLDMLNRVTEKTETMFVVITHNNKGAAPGLPGAPPSGATSREVRGSGAIVDAASALIQFSGNGHELLTISEGKPSMGSPSKPIDVRFVDCGEVDPGTGKSAGIRIEWVPPEEAAAVRAQGGTDSAATARVSAEILRILAQDQPLTVNGVKERVKGNSTAVGNTLKNALGGQAGYSGRRPQPIEALQPRWPARVIPALTTPEGR